MIFDEADIELQAENILITDGGALQIGTEDNPFQHKAIITLHGHLRSPELPVYGAKTLGVREGVLDLHGTPVNFYIILIIQCLVKIEGHHHKKMKKICDSNRL